MSMWQIAAGRSGINYVEVFRRYDVMLIGGGDRGSCEKFPDRYPKGRNFWNQVRRFATKPVVGDVVVMRFGHDATGVGLIPEEDPDYHWSEEFSDVLGWDLQHMRRVLWDDQALHEIESLNPVFEVKGAQATFSGIGTGRRQLYDREDALRSRIRDRDLKQLPELTEVLGDREVGVALFEEGLPNDSIDKVLRVIQRARRLRNWYRTEKSGELRPTEHEIVAHVVVPLLTGLGWSEQMMAVEWNNIDVALFRETPTDSDSCIAVVEVKRKASSFRGARKQALEYVEKNELNNCNDVIVTDGGKFYQYARRGGVWPSDPTGYINLKKIRRSHVVYEQVDSVRTLLELTPIHLSR